MGGKETSLLLASVSTTQECVSLEKAGDQSRKHLLVPQRINSGTLQISHDCASL